MSFYVYFIYVLYIVIITIIKPVNKHSLLHLSRVLAVFCLSTSMFPEETPNSNISIKQESDEQTNSPNTQQKTVISQLPATGKQKIKNETSRFNSFGSYLGDEGKSIKGCIHTCDNYQQMKDCADLADEHIVGVPAGDHQV